MTIAGEAKTLAVKITREEHNRILTFDDMGDRDKKWAAFRADQGRIAAFAETEADGPLVASVYNTILETTP